MWSLSSLGTHGIVFIVSLNLIYFNLKLFRLDKILYHHYNILYRVMPGWFFLVLVGHRRRTIPLFCHPFAETDPVGFDSEQQ